MTEEILDKKRAISVIKNLRKSIQKYFKENNLTYAIFGKSEGLDSSVIAGLLSSLKGVKPVGVIMPCESKPDAERIAKIVLDYYKIPYIRVDLTEEYKTLVSFYNSEKGLNDQLKSIMENYGDSFDENFALRKSRCFGNIKVRLRMITLYYIAQVTGGIVISTDNLSEFWTGFWTLNGDVGDLAPIQNIWKGLEEKTIAEVLKVPEESLNAVPTDGLEIIPNGTDEDQLGLPYPELDRVIISLLRNKFDGSERNNKKVSLLSKQLSKKLGYSEDKIRHVAYQMINTHYKRNWPKVFSRKETGLLDLKDIKI